MLEYGRASKWGHFQVCWSGFPRSTPSMVDSLGPRSEGLFIYPGSVSFPCLICSVWSRMPQSGRHRSRSRLETSTTDLTRCSRGQRDLRLPWKTGYSSLQLSATAETRSETRERAVCASLQFLRGAIGIRKSVESYSAAIETSFLPVTHCS